MSEHKRREQAEKNRADVRAAHEIHDELLASAQAEARRRLVEVFGNEELPTAEQMAVLRQSLVLTAREAEWAASHGDTATLQSLGRDLAELGKTLEGWELRSSMSEPTRSDMLDYASEALAETEHEREKLIAELREDFDKGKITREKATECLQLLGASIEDAVQSRNVMLVEEYSAAASDVWAQAMGLESEGKEETERDIRQEVEDIADWMVKERFITPGKAKDLIAEGLHIRRSSPTTDLQDAMLKAAEDIKRGKFRPRAAANPLHPVDYWS